MTTDSDPIWSRRQVLASAAAVGALGVAAGSAAGHDHNRYVIEQHGRCRRIEPLSGEKPVRKLYRWGQENRFFSSTGTTDLQRADTSILFLYDGPDGLSLVVVHDKLDDDTPGGSVSFTIKNIPEDAEWVVQDDFYDGPANYDRWDIDDTRTEVDWTWGAERTDGGALRGLDDDDLSLTIDPRFNEDAELFERYYDGRIKRWEFLSGDLDDPDRYELDRDERLRLRRGTCDDDDDDDHHHDDEDDDDDHHDDKDDDDDHHDDDDDDHHHDDDDDHHHDEEKRRGPPDHAGPPEHAGPPDHAGPGGKGDD